MQTLSKPAPYLGGKKPHLPDFDKHTATSEEFFLEPNWLIFSKILAAKEPQVRVKKARLLQRDRTAEEDY